MQRGVGLARQGLEEGGEDALAGGLGDVDEDERAEIVRVDERVGRKGHDELRLVAALRRPLGEEGGDVAQDEARGVRIGVEPGTHAAPPSFTMGASAPEPPEEEGTTASAQNIALKTGTRTSVPCATPYCHISRSV